MATIITKNSSTASSVPLAAQLVQGELAVNVTDKRLFTENSGGTVVELGTTPSSLSTGALAYTGTLTGGTGVVNLGSGQVYKDASGNVGIGTSSPTEKLDVSGAISTTSNAANFNQAKTTLDYASGAGRIAAYISTGSNLQFYTNPNAGTVTERARIDSSGNLGIGTSSPLTPLHVVGAIQSQRTGGVSQYARMVNSGGTATFISDNQASGTYTGFQFQGLSTASGTPTTYATIDGSGNLLVGTTDLKGAVTVGKVAPNSAYGQICAFSPTAGDSNISGMSIVKYANDSTTAQVLMRFLMNQGGTGQGQINANGANTAAFGSYSDSRLKENIVDLPSQLDNIMALRPVEYDYIESMGGGHQIGFVAQEVQAVYPDLVGEDADGMLTLTDMNKNDARLIKCIQEQQAIITALTTRITALEAK